MMHGRQSSMKNNPEQTVFKLCFYVPESHLESVKKAVFNAGAGRIGSYDQCCWQVKGEGQFRPLDGAKPFIGEKDKVEILEEYKVEMVLADELVTSVIEALKSAHPYEEPAYDVWQLSDF